MCTPDRGRRIAAFSSTMPCWNCCGCTTQRRPRIPRQVCRAVRFIRALEARAERAAAASQEAIDDEIPDGSRCTAINADAVLCELHGRRADKVDQTALRGARANVARLSLSGRGQQNTNDTAPALALDHGMGNILGVEQRTTQNDAHLALELLQVIVEPPLPPRTAALLTRMSILP